MPHAYKARSRNVRVFDFLSGAVNVPGSVMLPCVERTMGGRHAAYPYATFDGGLRRVYFGINFNLYPDS